MIKNYFVEVGGTFLLLMIYAGAHLLGGTMIGSHSLLWFAILIVGVVLLVAFWRKDYNGIKLRRVIINATITYATFGYLLIVINT